MNNSLIESLMESAKEKALAFVNPLHHTLEEKRLLCLAFMSGYALANIENEQGSKTEKNGENGSL